MSDLKNLEATILLCKKHGVRRLKTEEVEVEFAPEVEGPDGKKMKALSEAFARGEVTDEQLLFLSAPQPVSQEQVEAYMKQVNGG